MFKEFQKLKVLNLRNNFISILDGYPFSTLLVLYELDISFNSILNINGNFSRLDKLSVLNLQNNIITNLKDFSFSNLTSLRTLNLAFNRIHFIHKKAFDGLSTLTKLNLTGNRIKVLAPSRFVALLNLEILDLSNNGLNILDYSTFQGLQSVKYLHIHNNKLTVYRTMFQGLCNLGWLHTDSYVICCAKPSTVSSNNCIAPRDSISSCEQLISVGFLSQMIWYMALFSVIGNAFVIYYRNCGEIRGSASHCVFVLHLSISDFLMGLYLFIIAIADLEYQNIYGFNDSEWRYSKACTIAGLLATTSSEASVIFIFLITLERFIVLKHPFSAGVFKNRRLVILITIIAWLSAIAFSAVPLFVYQDFYSRSTVCISLPLTTERVSGWEYSTLLFIGFNLLIFLAVVILQLLIYIHVKRMGSKTNNDNTKREMKVLRSLSYVVVSDTLCWIPIIVIGLMAYGGVGVSPDIYAWVIVVVLPINSALNPFIYTFSMIYRRKARK
nr:G-protein coupled receptor GRL101 [Crassostrea gigas]